MSPRHASKVEGGFPYNSRLICYIETLSDGTVQQGCGEETYQSVLAGKSKLYAVWPGQWRSDLFLVDDIEEYARALGFSHQKNDHVHDVDWKIGKYGNNASGTYVNIDVKLLCDCKIDDLKAFAREMREQKGWDIATSMGWGSHGPDGDMEYSLRARKSSLS